jgi:hypothetical protein
LPAKPLTLDKAELVAWMRGDDITDEDTTDEVNYDQALRILQAFDQAAVLRDDEVVKIATLVDTDFVVLDVSWRKGNKNEGGPSRYAFMTCANNDGTKFLTSCGAAKVVLQLRKAEVEGWFPWVVRLDEIETAAGRTMYQLIAPETSF